MDSSHLIWIVKKNGNIAVWPCGGTFLGPLRTVGGVYEVKAQPLQLKPTSDSPTLYSPFGAYMLPPYPGSMWPSPLVTPAHPPVKRKKGWSKTVVLVLFRKREGKGGSTKGNSRVEYDIVTQVTVTQWHLTRHLLAQFAEWRTLLVSRLQLMSFCWTTSATHSLRTTTPVWRSFGGVYTRKVLAANQAIYGN